MSKAKRTPRLGKGLSSLVGRPVKVAPPADQVPSQREISQPTQPAVRENAATAPAGSTAASNAVGAAVDLHPDANRPHTLDNPANPGSAIAQVDAAPDMDAAAEGLHYLAVTAIRPNRHQPRQQFDEGALARLADSIRREGVMQPIVVRPVEGQRGRYELVAGERRWRAAQLAELTQIPAMIRELDEKQIAEWALIENLQREDLNPIERALAFQHLIDQFHLSHDQVADQVGIDRSSVTNSLRLLGLCESVRAYVRDGLLSGGQAKVLVGVTDARHQQALADRALKEAWSVRKLEQEVRAALSGPHQTAPSTPSTSKPGSAWAAHLSDLESQLGQQLGSKVKIRPGRKKGTGALTIEFFSVDHFDELLGRLGVTTE
jgi:ParB family chromosome partitioning protein